MKVLLLSDDPVLPQLCREIAARNPEQGLKIYVGPRSHAVDADLCIADYRPDSMLPPEMDDRGACRVFLVEREHIQDFTDCHLPHAAVILKPVTRAVLQAFLIPGNRGSGRTGGDSDEMLDYLRDANVALQQYDLERTSFLGRAVHDFHAPLTALRGYCGLLLAEQLGPLTDSQQEVLQRMQNSTTRLSRLAATVSQLSAAERFEQRPVLQRGDLRECFNEALEELLPLTNEKRLGISLDCGEAPDALYFDRAQIQQVLVNLLDNVCRLTPRLGSIEINGYPFFWERRLITGTYSAAAERRRGAWQAPNAFRVDIRNTGPSMPADRLKTSTWDWSGGGLAMVVCQLIITQHHGRIWAESGPEGAMFSFVLPYYRSEHPIEHPNGAAKYLMANPIR